MVGDDKAMVRCPVHRDVVDADAWKKVRAAMPALFDSEAEALAHFLADYGAGLDLVRELHIASVLDSDCDDVPVTHH
jgi:hypothetical protein